MHLLVLLYVSAHSLGDAVKRSARHSEMKGTLLVKGFEAMSSLDGESDD